MPWANDSDMANYAFLMQTSAIQYPASMEYILVRMTLVGVGLSVVGGLLSVFLICYVPVRSDALFSVCNMCVALIGAQLAFAGAENAFPEKIMCKVSTASLHFLFLSVHGWSLAFSTHLIMKLYRIFHGRRGRRRFLLVLVGWGIPLVVVATTALAAKEEYGNNKLCWLNVENGTQWAFVAPVCFICSVNILVLMLVMFIQFRHDIKKDNSLVKCLRNAGSTFLTHLPVSNVTWLLGLAPASSFVCQYLFVMINASQGMFIFALHMLCSSQIRALLKTRLTGESAPEGGAKRQEMSQSGSTGNTQSMEMDVAGEGLKSISYSKRGET